MEKTKIIEALKKLRAGAVKKKFKQSVDLVINLTNVDMKTLKVADSVELPFNRGKTEKMVVVAEGDTALKAKPLADLVIAKNELSQYNKKSAKPLARRYYWFVVQSTLMPQFAGIFGQTLGARGKMPYPKDVLPPVGDPKTTIERLKKSIRVKIKDRPIIHAVIGTEEMNDDQLAENALAVHHAIVNKLEKGEHQVGAIYLKTTMGKPVKV